LNVRSFTNVKRRTIFIKLPHSATIDLEKLVSMPQGKKLAIRTYTNANFVNLASEKKMYQDFERVAKSLGSTAETIIGNAMILILKEIEKVSMLSGEIVAEK